MQEAAGRVYKEMYYKEYDHFRAMAQPFMRATALWNRTSGRHGACWALRSICPPGTPSSVPWQGSRRAAMSAWCWSMVRRRHSLSTVSTLEAERAARRARFMAAARRPIGYHAHALYHAVPRLAPGIEVQRKPVIAAGEFVWGDVLITAGYPEGMPCSR